MKKLFQLGKRKEMRFSYNKIASLISIPSETIPSKNGMNVIK